MPDNQHNQDISKLLNKICKLQDNQQKSREEEFALLKEQLKQMNESLDQLTRLMGSNINIAATHRPVPFHHSVKFLTALKTRPSNPDDYPADGIVNVYALNNSRSIPYMSLVNDGPGDVYFITAQSKDLFNTQEIVLHPNDLRELYNVYEIRSRTTLPLTQFRLVEGIIRTGSNAPFTKSNVEIRPTFQLNEILKIFVLTFDNQVPTITITSPATQTLVADYSVARDLPPLPPGETAALIDENTGYAMPYNIPEGCIFESNALFTNFTCDFTIRSYFEFIPGKWTLVQTFPINSRGYALNPVFNLSYFTSGFFDTDGSPPGGRNILITITNDDPCTHMIGFFEFDVIIRRLS